MITITNLKKAYKKQSVLDIASLVFEDGQITGLVGPNGCGKTTLMRCICGFSRPSSGTVTVCGKVVGKDCDFAPSTGVIIETPAFLPHDDARKNLAILAGISGGAVWAVVALAVAVWAEDQLLTVSIPDCIYYLLSASVFRTLFGVQLPHPATLYNDMMTVKTGMESLAEYGALLLLACFIYVRGVKRRGQNA